MESQSKCIPFIRKDHLEEKKQNKTKTQKEVRWLNSRKSILLKARRHPSNSLGLTNEKSRKAHKPRLYRKTQ